MAEATIELRDKYEPRRVTPLGVRSFGDWRLKVYGISYRCDRPREELVAAGLEAAGGRLPHRAISGERYGIGFIGIHDGCGENWVFVDWWERENELHHHVFISPSNDPASLRPAADGVAIACVWDLAVIGHERDAWVRHVLGSADAPDIAAYLRDLLDARV